jgi:hypothetical protein
VEAAKTADQTDSKLTEKKVEKKIEKVKVKYKLPITVLVIYFASDSFYIKFIA